jgi:hypothetical protein
MNPSPALTFSPASQHLFQVQAADLGKLLEQCGLCLSPLSPLEIPLARPAADAGLLAAMAQDDWVRRSLQVLAQPRMRLRIHSGGGMSEPGWVGLCADPNIHTRGAVVLTPSFENSFLVQWFDERDAALDWILEGISTPAESPGEGISGTLRMGAFLQILHTLDLFKRASSESLLNSDTGMPAIPLSTYTETLARDWESLDLRWLLPAFLRLVPESVPRPGDLELADIEELVRQDLLTAGKGERGQPMLGFAAKGLTLGVEFLRTWWIANGIELAWHDGVRHRVHWRAFVASTGLSNHTFTLREDGLVEGAALSRAELRQRLSGALRACPWAAQASLPAPPPLPASRPIPSAPPSLPPSPPPLLPPSLPKAAPLASSQMPGNIGNAMLVVLQGPQAGLRVPIGSRLTLGREASCGLILEDSASSRQHAFLEVGAQGLVLTDLGSSNGTYVNGQRIQAPVLIGPQDRIAIGQTAFMVQW